MSALQGIATDCVLPGNLGEAADALRACTCAYVLIPDAPDGARASKIVGAFLLQQHPSSQV